MKNSILEVDNLKVWFNTDTGMAKAVNDISFSLVKGETLAIVGESGCGKSVTALSILRLLNKKTIYNPSGFSESTIRFQGDDILKMDDETLRQIRGNKISMIFQEPMTSLNPVHTIGTQLSETLILHQGMTKEEAFKAGVDVLSKMGIPAPEQVMKNYPHQLSGGMKQRVMIGMALSCKPEILIADEPTTALDVTIQAQILLLIKQLKDELNMALVLITHDLGIVNEVSDRIIVMYGGKIVETGTTEEIFHQPKHPYTKALLKSRPNSEELDKPLYTIQGIVEPATMEIKGCRFSRRCDNAVDYCRNTKPDETKISETQSLFCFMYDSKCTDIIFNQEKEPCTIDEKNEKVEKPENNKEKPVLEIEKLQVWFPVYKGWFKKIAGHVRAVDDFSVVLREGKTLGLVGESGCGKTTFGQSLVGLVEATGGKIIFKGEETLSKEGKDLKELRRKLQIVFQDPFSSLSPSMLIKDIVGEGLTVHNIVNDPKEINKLIESTLVEVGLDPAVMDRYPHQFSGGQRQRISIARALVLKPELVILDESTSALDVSVQAQILNLLKDLQKKHGLTYIFISHDLGVIEFLADYVAVMYLGRVVEIGSRYDIFNNPKHPYTMSLIDAVPKIGKPMKKNLGITGDVPSPISPPQGCHFHPRCPMYKKYNIEKCIQAYPPERPVSSSEHRVSCYWLDNVNRQCNNHAR